MFLCSLPLGGQQGGLQLVFRNARLPKMADYHIPTSLS